MANPYTLGRGKLYFRRAGTEGFRYFGNTPEVNISISEEKLEHFSSDEGVREKDLSIPLTANRTGSFITDSIKPENVALFFFGEISPINQSLTPVSDEGIDDVQQDYLYQLGETPQAPAGVRGVGNVVVVSAVDPSPAFIVDVDYTVDLDAGAIYIIPDGGIVNGTDLLVDYNILAATYTRILSGATAVNGSLRYLESNAEGPDKVIFMESVNLSPNGDFALKGDELQQIPFTMEILKPAVNAAIIVDGVPVYA